MYQILSPEGSINDRDAFMALGFSGADCLKLYEYMMLTRVFEEYATPPSGIEECWVPVGIVGGRAKTRTGRIVDTKGFMDGLFLSINSKNAIYKTYLDASCQALTTPTSLADIRTDVDADVTVTEFIDNLDILIPGDLSSLFTSITKKQ